MSAGDNVVKEIFNNNTDCFVCRAISSFAMVAGGAFLVQQRKNFGKVNMYCQTVLGLGLFYAGFARALSFPPFEDTEFVNKIKLRAKSRSEAEA